MGYQSKFEIVRIEDIHLAAAAMAQGFMLHGCELAGDGWAKFCILAPEARKDELQALVGVTRESHNPEDDVLIPFGAYRKALSELRGVLRQAKGDTHNGRRQAAGVAPL